MDVLWTSHCHGYFVSEPGAMGEKILHCHTGEEGMIDFIFVVLDGPLDGLLPLDSLP